MRYFKLFVLFVCFVALIFPLCPQSLVSLSFFEHKDAFDFGDILQNQKTSVSHSFSIINSGAAPELIDSVLPTCGCVSVKVNDKTAPSIRLLPGEIIVVQAAIDLTKVSLGSFDKSIVVTCVDRSNPLIFHLIGDLQSPFLIHEHDVDFGQINYGEALTRSINIDLLHFQATDLSKIEAFSSDPDLVVSLDFNKNTDVVVHSITLHISVSKHPLCVNIK